MVKKPAMSLEDFRKKHSEVIEHYQFIEYNLEGIYAALQEKKSFMGGMEDVEKDNIKALMNRIRRIQKERNECIISEEEYEAIIAICDRRNFWCHNCYVDLVFDCISGDLRDLKDAKALTNDIISARAMRDRLFERKMQLIDNWDKIIGCEEIKNPHEAH